ncbi:hypothetical protein M9Y10_013645 [Tritrichomonas musculus]|uniref:Uncharacterized protein n=1 Tax=Tritrichomonas musculus TaxID=1915356 RepID=A0ABR2L0I3_9EUKA
MTTKDKKNRNKRSHTIKVQSTLQNYLEEVPMPSIMMAVPPPKGQTARWRNKVLYKPQVRNVSRIADKEIQTENPSLSLTTDKGILILSDIIVKPFANSSDYSKQAPTLMTSQDSTVFNEKSEIEVNLSLSTNFAYEILDDQAHILVLRPHLKIAQQNDLFSINPQTKKFRKLLNLKNDLQLYSHLVDLFYMSKRQLLPRLPHLHLHQLVKRQNQI